MRLIHCADLHLDAPLTADFTAEQARLRRHELLHTFSRMVDYAEKHAVQAVLIAGDLFDRSTPNRATVHAVTDIMESHSGIDFFYLRGNHDAAFCWPQPVPRNLHTFTDTWRSYTCGEVTISGIEPTEPNEWYNTLQLSAQACNIVLLHGTTGTTSGTEQISLPLLRNRFIDYAAIGHVHAYRQKHLDARGVWAYAGCLEARGFDECGEKGFVLLDTAHGQITQTFVPFAQRTIHRRTVRVATDHTMMQCQDHVLRETADISNSDMVYVQLCGEILPDRVMDTAWLTHLLSARFFAARVQDCTVIKINCAQYETEVSLKGAFYRLLQAADVSVEDREEILRVGFAALNDEEIPI